MARKKPVPSRAGDRAERALIALGEVGQAIGSTGDVDGSLKTIVERAVELTGADSGTIYEFDGKAGVFVLRVTTNPDDEFVEIQRAVRLRRGEGAVGRAARAREPIQVADITVDHTYDSQLYGGLLHAGTRSLLAVPVLHGTQILGAVAVSRRVAGKFPPEAVAILKILASQSALVLQTARTARG